MLDRNMFAGIFLIKLSIRGIAGYLMQYQISKILKIILRELIKYLWNFFTPPPWQKVKFYFARFRLEFNS